MKCQISYMIFAKTSNENDGNLSKFERSHIQSRSIVSDKNIES